MKIELIDKYTRDDGKIEKNYLVDGGWYQVIVTYDGKYIYNLSIHCNCHTLPRIKFEEDTLRIVIYTGMQDTMNVDNAEALEKCNYAYKVAKAIKKRFLKG